MVSVIVCQFPHAISHQASLIILFNNTQLFNFKIYDFVLKHPLFLKLNHSTFNKRGKVTGLL